MAIGRIPEPGTGIPESIVDAKGDIVTATAADTPARLAVGTNEQRLVADSAAATGLKYVSDTTNYAVAAKGDLLVGTAADTVAVLSVGTNGHTLVADSSTATGLAYAAPAGGGKVLQVVSATITTATTIATQTDTDTNITATITPTSATSTILLLVSYGVNISATNSDVYAGGKLLRGATTIGDFGSNELLGIYDANSSNHGMLHRGNIIILDSPATTSATTYKLQARLELTPSGTGRTFTFQYGSSPSSITLLEIGA